MTRRILLLGVTAATIAVTAAAAFRLARPAGALDQVARAAPVRPFAPRLSIPLRYHPCTPDPSPAEGTVPRERCGENADAPPRVEALAGAGAGTLDPDTLRAAALAALVWWDGTEATQGAALARLDEARRLSSDPAGALVDLSGAYLARAERTRNARDLVEGLDAALEALALEPANHAALFNAALALQWIGMRDEAVRAWDAYLAADPRSPWAEEARRRRGETAATEPPPEDPTPASDDAAVRAFAARDPERARTLGWEGVLGEWGGAVLAGDTARAGALLRLAERLGEALESRGGDRSLADAARVVRDASNDPAATRLLARSHRAYAAGVGYRTPGDPAARDSFAVVLRLRPPSPALLGWARAAHARALAIAGAPDRAFAELEALSAATDSLRHPALLARTRWTSGTLLLRRSEFAAARERHAAASAAFARLGEGANFGMLRYLEGETAHEQGDTLRAYAKMHEALRALRPHRGRIELHNVLLELAEFAEKDGMLAAALRIHDEDVAVALGMENPTAAPEALQARARVRALVGSTEDALADLERAAVLVPPLGLEHFTHTLRYSRAVLATRLGDPRLATEMDSAVAYFAGQDNVVWLLPTLLRRADLRLLGGDLAGADADLDTVTSRIRALSGSADDVHLRAAMLQQARSRFDQRVMLHVRAGRPAEALAALERGRLSFTDDGEGGNPSSTRPGLPAGETGIAYALIGDTLLTWTLRGDSVRLLERRVDRDALLREAERAVMALESAARAPRAEPHLNRLYGWLVRPVRDRLGPPGSPLSLLADGPLAGVPFAALRDVERGRYLVEDHPLRVVAGSAGEGLPRGAPAPRRALLVADPAFDAALHPTLERLASAREEARALRALYPASSLLEGTGATADALRSAASDAEVIHFAGHAVFDDARPERSFLVLAGADTLAAESAASLELGGARLVVLSACRTLRARGGRSDGMAGLTGALLAAGAEGVVGTLWQVDDRLTRPLMLEFHRGYAASASAAEALREAQLAMLRSPDPALRSPFAWAAFRYVGR